MKTNKTAVKQVVLDRFVNHRLPRIQEIKTYVDQGEKLNEFDILFLTEVFNDASAMYAQIDQESEYVKLAIKAIELYHHITEKALENEQKSQ